MKPQVRVKKPVCTLCPLAMVFPGVDAKKKKCCKKHKHGKRCKACPKRGE